MLPWVSHSPQGLEEDVDALHEAVRTKLSQYTMMAERFGRTLPKPYMRYLHGSKHGEMWEFRFDAARGVWRVAIKFDDANRRVVLLAVGNKRGKNQRRFYRDLIAEADARYTEYLAGL